MTFSRARGHQTHHVLVALALVAGLVATVGRAHGAYPGANGKIAFETNRDGNEEIYSMNPDGSELVNLTQDPAFDRDPAWSPDGTRIAFVKGSEGHANIWVMDADGGNQTNLTPARRPPTWPTAG